MKLPTGNHYGHIKENKRTARDIPRTKSHDLAKVYQHRFYGRFKKRDPNINVCQISIELLTAANAKYSKPQQTLGTSWDLAPPNGHAPFLRNIAISASVANFRPSLWVFFIVFDFEYPHRRISFSRTSISNLFFLSTETLDQKKWNKMRQSTTPAISSKDIGNNYQNLPVAYVQYPYYPTGNQGSHLQYVPETQRSCSPMP